MLTVCIWTEQPGRTALNWPGVSDSFARLEWHFSTSRDEDEWGAERDCCVVSLLIPERIYISRSLLSLNLSNPLSLRGNPVRFLGIHVAKKSICFSVRSNESGHNKWTILSIGHELMEQVNNWPHNRVDIAISKPHNCALCTVRLRSEANWLICEGLIKF